MEEKQHIKSQDMAKPGRIQDHSPGFLTWSHQQGGMEEGMLIYLLRSISDRETYPKPDRQIKGRMGKTKELAKNCPSTYYMERGLTSRVSLWLPDLQNSVSFISFSEG